MASDDYDADVQAIGRAPGAIAAQAATANPDQAARSYNLSKVTGAPVTTIENDPEFEARIKARAAGSIVNANPQLRSYVVGNPSAAKVSSDDLSQLDTISKTVNEPQRIRANDSVIGAANKAQEHVQPNRL